MDTPASRSTPFSAEKGAPQARRETLNLVWVVVKLPSESGRPAELLHQLLGNEHVAEHDRKYDHQDHLQYDAGTGDIAADLAESTTQKRLH
jgi:hypothetical protein